MKKCGLVYEGTLRQADFSNKGIVDACMYSLLKEDWEKEPLYSFLYAGSRNSIHRNVVEKRSEK